MPYYVKEVSAISEVIGGYILGAGNTLEQESRAKVYLDRLLNDSRWYSIENRIIIPMEIGMCFQNIRYLKSKDKTLTRVYGLAREPTNELYYWHSWAINTQGYIIESVPIEWDRYYGFTVRR